MIIIDLSDMRPFSSPVLPPAVLCLGNFDGVHRGHAALIGAAVKQAEALRTEVPGVRSGAWCFATSPRRRLGGERHAQITSLREKLEWMASLGLELAYLGEFSSLCSYSPEQFISEILQKECRCISTVCGFNHRFGRGGRGKPSDLEAVFGTRALVVPPVNDMGQGVVISSSYIRSLLREGQMEEAVRLLGHPFVLRAPVMHGKALGRTIGLPTVNQNFPAGHLIPARGIYATRVSVDGRSYIGVTNVGNRPTVEDSGRVNSETFILDFNETLYGKVITTEFYGKLRDEKKFGGLQELQDAIRADAQNARLFFARREGGAV